MESDHASAGPSNAASEEFAKQAEQASPGIIREFVQFLSENKKWWLTPILIAVGLIAVLVALSATPAATLIYPLF